MEVGKVMECSGAGDVMKERERVPVMDCEIFTLQGAGAKIKERSWQIWEAGGRYELKKTLRC
jgi:hypothetical protein